MSDDPEDLDRNGPFALTEAARRELETAANANGLWRFGVRVRRAHKTDASKGFDLSFEELPEADDEIFRSRGIRFFVGPEVAATLGERVVIDARGGRLVFR
ncbi:MAG: hypothetical protein KC635_13960 [Myxococcales bacterium]|nr:hypothetical protein [Myxococcales bacterium]MCB9731043.1 hypothetical protein [Deltaproteobacteria bacterium]